MKRGIYARRMPVCRAAPFREAGREAPARSILFALLGRKGMKSMKKAVLVPDSFKGTLGAERVSGIMESSIRKHFPECRILSVPAADGGEGITDCFLKAFGGTLHKAAVKNPYFENINALFGILSDGTTAVVEVAACVGLPLVENRKNPMVTTTYGVGQLILAAAEQGCKKIIVGLGGSCTNDCGCGAAAAVGVKFFNAAGRVFLPAGESLKDVARIDVSAKSPLLDGVELIAMCDVRNTMYGPEGAAYVFAPQKGANERMVRELDAGLVHISRIIERDLGLSVQHAEGGGAAGAMGAGMLAFFGARLQQGIETVLDLVQFDRLIEDADVIFTGEGRLDGQSAGGKVISGVARRAKRRGVPVIAVAGGIEGDLAPLYRLGVTAAFSINRMPEDFAVSRHKTEENLSLTMDSILRLMKIKSWERNG